MRFRYFVWTGAALSAGVLAYAAFSPGTLTIAGASVDTNYITQNNRVYVPIADVAKALKYDLSKTPTGFNLDPAGGANQVQGLSGKIGQVMNLGFATIKVVKVVRGDHYEKLFSTGIVDTPDEKQTIVAVVLRIKNATKQPMILDPFGDEHTAIVDNDEHSFQQFTGLACDITDRGPKILPGAAYDFALVFPVTKTAELTELVYGIKFYDGPRTHKDVRISLKE